MHATLPLLQQSDFPALRRDRLTTLQVNVGYRCNQACLHCHVNAGPKRKEMMTRETAGNIVDFLRHNNLETLDITGGAPELNPHFRYLVTAARELGMHVIDRCNLTVLQEEEQVDLAGFLAEQQVEIIASLPCYLEENVNGQRGDGVYARSISALQQLNELGYGKQGSNLFLNLVYNPTGPFLPPSQVQLEADYKRELAKQGICFNHLYTLTNLPIQRFGSTLISKGQFDEYMQLLKGAHQDANLQNVMCRSLISIDWQGYAYDCDFNQMLNLPLSLQNKGRPHITDLTAQSLQGLPIAVADHCYGCTAGQGSSCGGALARDDKEINAEAP